MLASIRRRHIWLAVLTLTVVSCLALGAWRVAYVRGLGEVERQVQDRLTVNLRSVESEIERFRYLPGVIGEDERILAMLEGPSRAAVEAANQYLQTVRAMSGADELYVLDLAGDTLAASNWNEPGSFVGHNYAFRPYFSDAMLTGSGRFYAVGVTTGKPGYFLSSRINRGNRAIGVVVAKVDMGPLALTWAAAGEMSAIADREGVIFLSGDPRWTYRPLQELDPGTVMRLEEQRRYDGIDIAAASPLAPTAGSNASSLFIGEDERHLLARRAVEPDGWQLLSALPLEPVEREARLIGGLAALVAVLGLGAWLLFNQRAQITRFKLDQNAVLEERVAERTKALAHEVETRRRAEAELRATQENLIHAAKLAALGRMSAAIVHEVSQPLSALDNTLAAADLHAQRNAPGEVRRLLEGGRSLLRRMQRTIKHLRSFSSRRDPGPPEPVQLAGVLDAAMDILTPQARDAGVMVTAVSEPGLPAVAGNAMRLEQVFINLVLNAIEATAAAGNSAVTLIARTEGGGVIVDIADTGTGIPDTVRERLFEPFFTTKKSGESLGLGLSISRTLLEEFGGSLRFEPGADGGTLARVALPLYQPSAVPKPLVSA
ncbi:ATP-binding protein [Devosia sp. XJ19-1]|uniref:histidine kinase n=1 Tax=Devosia ureilytica TaxID=2952754 RepID=A0A9Q4ASF8_9HYPH|nr:ATP-binding protein [Devosia ureilytica]MCP8885075.1 ATP-binding protein [Devosia ureilytica]MCP8888798.1 ATP-binding protein [Devosia ureilytica]